MVPPMGFPVEIAPKIGGDLDGDTAKLPEEIEAGLGLLERWPPVGPVDSFLALA